MKKTKSQSLNPKQITKINQILIIKKLPFEYYLFNLMIQTGLRCNEVVNLLNQIPYLQNMIKFKMEKVIEYNVLVKGKKTRKVYFNHSNLDKLIFSCYKENGNYYPKMISRTINKIGNFINIHLTPHDLRATCITMLDKIGVPITQISHFIGHRSIQMTYQYITRSPERMKKINNWFVWSNFEEDLIMSPIEKIIFLEKQIADLKQINHNLKMEFTKNDK